MPASIAGSFPSLGVFNNMPGDRFGMSTGARVSSSSPPSGSPSASAGTAARSPRIMSLALGPFAYPRTGYIPTRSPGPLSFSTRLPSYFREPGPGEVDPLTLPVRVRMPIFQDAPWACNHILTRLGEFVSCYGASGPWFSLSFLPPVAYWMPLSEGYEVLHFRGLPLQVWATGSLDDMLYDLEARTQCPVLRIRIGFLLASDQEAYRQLMIVIGGALDDGQCPQYAEALSFYPHSSIFRGGLRDATDGYTAPHLMPRLGLEEFHRHELDMVECLVVRTVTEDGSDGGFLLAEQLNRLSSCGVRPEPAARVGISFTASRRI